MSLFLQRKSRPARAGIFIFSLLLLALYVGGAISPFDPNAQDSPAESRFQAPSGEHLFGTDQFGRDVFVRVLYGGRLSLAISLGVVTLSVLLGSLYGALSAYLGGLWDYFMMRFVDILLSFPLVFLAITCIALFGSGIFYLITVLALTSWMDIARLVRAEVLSLKNQTFVTRIKASGLGPGATLIRHIVPNTFATVSAFAVLRMADIILIESSLSFIGLGVQPPQSSWGNILNDGWPVLAQAWWMSFFPGLAIVISIMSLNLIGSGLGAQREQWA